MNTKETLVPESIVKTLFEQTRQSSADNTIAIKEVTLAINNLIKTVITSPMNKDVIDEIKSVVSLLTSMDTKSESRASSIHTNLRNVADDIHKDTQKMTDDITEIVGSIDNGVKSLLSRVRTMIIVVTVAFSLLVATYLLVRNSIDTTVDVSVKKNIEQIINEMKK